MALEVKLCFSSGSLDALGSGSHPSATGSGMDDGHIGLDLNTGSLFAIYPERGTASPSSSITYAQLFSCSNIEFSDETLTSASIAVENGPCSGSSFEFEWVALTVPTPPPTSAPTPSPTPAPTPSPTVAPTVAPTPAPVTPPPTPAPIVTGKH